MPGHYLASVARLEHSLRQVEQRVGVRIAGLVSMEIEVEPEVPGLLTTRSMASCCDRAWRWSHHQPAEA